MMISGQARIVLQISAGSIAIPSAHRQYLPDRHQHDA
jgi:hypothetical protein